MNRFFVSLLVFVLGFASIHSPLFAWGQRGHEVITIVAARLLAEDPRVSEDFAKLMVSKEHMLAHLANTPDTVWRGGNNFVVQENAPTHFIDLEFVYPKGKKPSMAVVPMTIAALEANIKKNCAEHQDVCPAGDNMKEKLRRAGHVTFRVNQLATRIEAYLREMAMQNPKSKSFKRSEQVERLNKALLEMGLLSHFVGDLGNPLHTSSNYDGQLSKQNGLHSFFESRVVDAFDLSLKAEVFNYAKDREPFKRQVLGAHKPENYLEMAYGLALTSHVRVEDLLQLDRKHSLLEEYKPMQKTKRKSPESVAKAYHQFAVEQLALAADTLKELWIQTWLRSGKPGLSGLHSYDFPTSPEFIEVDYYHRDVISRR
ncbi:S1/P1 nuclease [Pseudobacteriovorax antillogorgiicola]|uniref:S1/P1 Nuclease n=1 Tax=Pseudobacteriovorax antillogorgiicola TaxID=1513793 RepID=A0A1Y6BMK1_9BACT|nr:S1/P1 nuclease [Pseudobacteriovorax antillogorgiicola]TCS55524.1 S1/P1 nuclease [Pseudobacteriovorax antillogorgiicola]SMF11344.1 S1/P1 Nuclease [Pseudobacteriovorax antillogorgiicola]